MSTLADELLNDFEDSASEGEEESRNGFLRESATPPKAAQTNGHKEHTSMVLDGDEEEDDDGAEDGIQNCDLKLEDADDEEEAKAKVEKMQLGRVTDVRTVAGLMKTLEPVLEVSPFLSLLRVAKFTVAVNIALTFPVLFRKSPTIRAYRPTNRTLLLVQSKTTPSTICLPRQILYQPLSTMKSFLSISSSEITTPPASQSSRPWSQTLWTTPRLLQSSAMAPWIVSKKSSRRPTISLVPL